MSKGKMQIRDVGEKLEQKLLSIQILMRRTLITIRGCQKNRKWMKYQGCKKII